MLRTFAIEYLHGGAVIQLYSNTFEKGLELIKKYKIPAFEEDPEYFPFKNCTPRELSSYEAPEIKEEGIILIHEFF